MYDYLIGMEFAAVVEELESRGVCYDFGDLTDEEAFGGCYELYIGGLYSDSHYDLDFDEDGVLVAITFWDEGWD